MHQCMCRYLCYTRVLTPVYIFEYTASTRRARALVHLQFIHCQVGVGGRRYGSPGSLFRAIAAGVGRFFSREK